MASQRSDEMTDDHTAGQRGASLGLPAAGPGALAGFGRRLAALAVDCVLSFGVALMVVTLLSGQTQLPGTWSAFTLFVEYTFFVGFFAQTPGMRLLGIACVRLPAGGPIGLWRAAVRAALLQLLVPAVITDSNGRGWHDRAVQSVMVRTK